MVAAILRAADPVVTSEAANLRFESFSACCVVYARLDVLSDGLDGAPAASGTTNVDFNPPMREALAPRVGSQSKARRPARSASATGASRHRISTPTGPPNGRVPGDLKFTVETRIHRGVA